MIVLEAEPVDAEEILALQKAAYESEALLYEDRSLPPLTQTLQEMLADFERQLVLKAVEGERIVGSVRASMHGETCLIARLVVHPDFQGRGLGTRLLEEIEARFPRARRFELFTGHRSEKALHIYGKSGYKAFRTERVHERLNLVYLEKLSGKR